PKGQPGCPQMGWAHPAGHGEAAGLMPHPPRNRSPTRVADATTADRLRRRGSIPARLRVEVGARRRPPFQRLRYPTAPCPLRFLLLRRPSNEATVVYREVG